LIQRLNDPKIESFQDLDPREIFTRSPSPTMADTYGSGSLGGGGSYPGSNVVNPSGDYIDLHELAKGWKAAIARAKDPATR
jgi:hypothetical protein